MNKSPYEIRLDVLKLAHDVVYNNRLLTSNQNMIYENQVLGNTNPSFSNGVLPPINGAYTIDDIIDKANKLYSFVNNNSKTIT